MADPESYTPLESHIMDSHHGRVPTLLQKVMHRCNEMMLVCTWQGEDRPCMELFQIW